MNFRPQTQTNTEIHAQPQSEVYIKQHEADIYHLRTYSLALEKVGVEKMNTIIDTGKNTSKIVAPLIIKQTKNGLNSQQSQSEINLDNCVQFNQQPSLTFMNSNLATFNFIKVNSNIDLQQQEFDDKDYSPNIQHDENNFESHQLVQVSPRNISKFKAAGNLIMGIRRLQINVVEQIQTSEQFYQKFSPSPCQTSTNKVHPIKMEHDHELADILNHFKLVDHLINHCMWGSDNDISQMIRILQKDPKRNLTNPQDPHHIINQLNQYGQNALYVAAKNGHHKVVKFLLSSDCNPHIRSKLYNDVLESPLEVSVRWHHIECVRTFLDTVKFTNQELRRAIKISENEQITQMLQRKLSSSLFSCCYLQ